MASTNKKKQQEVTTPQWEDGIFDRLAAGEIPSEELGQPQKGCGIWQLKKGVEVTMRFIGYEDLVKKFGEPSRHNTSKLPRLNES